MKNRIIPAGYAETTNDAARIDEHNRQASGVAEPDDEPAFAPWFDANEHLLKDRGYTPRDYAMFAWHAALRTPAQAPSTPPAPAAVTEGVAPDTSAVWSAIADYVMAGEALQRRRTEGHLMNAEWIDAVESAVAAVDRAVRAALRTPAQAPSTGAIQFEDDTSASMIGNHDAHPSEVSMPTKFAWTPEIAALSAPPVVQPASPAVEVASDAMETAFYEEVSPALDESTMNECQAWFNLGWRAALERGK